jgi:hypothetical protein
MVDVVFAVQSGDVGSSEGSTAVVAEKAEAAEVVSFAERVLRAAVAIVGRKEL